jgi:hypothetical protein
MRHGLRLALPSIIAFGKGCAERVNPRPADGCDLADTPERLKELLQKLEAGQLPVVERVKILRAAARRRGFRRRSKRISAARKIINVLTDVIGRSLREIRDQTVCLTS